VSRVSIVTTSWDDGDPCDLRVAELLRARGLPGTFYAPFVGHHGREVLTPRQLRELVAEGFEVGGHTLSHSVLPELLPRKIAWEVGACKSRLEDILGEHVRMFCYPKGQFNTNVIQHVKRAGYEGARTTRMLRVDAGFDAFEMPTSVQAYPHSQWAYIKNLARHAGSRDLCKFLINCRGLNWREIGKKLFDRVLFEGGVWHLYGHSWEIERLNLWNDLREMLDHVSKRDDVIYLSNFEVTHHLAGNSKKRASSLTNKLPALG